MGKAQGRLYVVSWSSKDFRRSGLQKIRADDRAEAVAKLRKRIKGGGSAYVSAVLYR